jgi:N-methylhydantoinase A
LGLDVMAAAEAIVRVADARMAGAIRLVSIERGHDPAKFAAMPFGGGGALHAGALVKDVGLQCAIVPPFPGVTSAFGCVIADIRHDQVQTLNYLLDDLDLASLDKRMVEAARTARKVVKETGVSVENIEVSYELDMHYLGQTHTVAVPLPVTFAETGTGVSGATIRSAFEKAYSASFSRLLGAIRVRIVSLRTAAVGKRPPFDISVFAPASDNSLEKASRGNRQVWLAGGWQDVAIWSRLDLPAGAVIEGPAILEQPDATIVVEPGLLGRVDPLGNIILERMP